MSDLMMDFRTPAQRERDDRNKKIWSEFTCVRGECPANVTKWAIYRTIGEKYGLKPQGVRYIVEKMDTEKIDNNNSRSI